MRLWGVLFAVLLLGACGGASDRSSLDDAADATAATTAQFEMKFELPPIDGVAEETFTMRGLFDFGNEAGLVRGLEGPDAASAGERPSMPVEMRILGRTVYERWIVKGKTYWIRTEEESRRPVDPFEVLVPFPGGPTAPTEVLDVILRSSDDVRVLGDDVVRETATTHYRAAIDAEKLIDQLPADSRPTAQDREDWNDRLARVEVWVDEESRVRRISFEEDDAEGGFGATLDLYDFGVDVDVRPPPKEEIVSQEEFDRLIGDLPAVSSDDRGQFICPGNGDKCEELGPIRAVCGPDSTPDEKKLCAEMRRGCEKLRAEKPELADECLAALREGR